MTDAANHMSAAGLDVQETAQRLIQSEQLTCRAVIIPAGADPMPYLREAGIVEPVSIPFGLVADGATAGSMGDGATPGLPAVFKPDHDPAAQAVPGLADEPTARRNEPTEKGEGPRVETVMLPDAFGTRPLAPVRRLTRT